MILHDMDYPTIFRQMYDESEKVGYYQQKNLMKVFMMKQGKYLEPCSFYDIIKMKDTNNEYLLYWYILDPEHFYFNSDARREKDLLHGGILIVKDDKGRLNGITCKRYKEFFGDDCQMIDAINVFTPHFFSRYRERFELPSNYTNLDVIGSFCARNTNYFIQLDYDEMVLPKNKQENGCAFAIKDGIMLGEQIWTMIDNKKVHIIKNKTFLGDKHLFENQANQNPTKESVVKIAREYFKKFNGYDPMELL